MALMADTVDEKNLNNFGRFDALKATVDNGKAKAYFEKQDGILGMNIKTSFIKIYEKQFFHPNWLMGIWLNPFFITRNKLMQGIEEMALDFKGGLLLDIGCGSKPYEDLFNVKEYVGIDIEVSGHDHVHSKIDKFYDGKNIPYQDEHFDWIFSSEVFEHVFNLEELLEEISLLQKQDNV